MAAKLTVTTKADKQDSKLPTIPGYRILGQLGTGGMATVYLANQESFDREVALKVMAPVLAVDANYGERFMREARIAARFSHPNIIAVYDVGVHENHYYIAMEYHPGGDLKGRLKRNMTTKQAMSILRQIAAALDYAHNKGYIHRDVKPDNILFRDDGSAVLTDFGIARPTADGDTQMTQLGMVVGTPKYMSPEQARGQDLDARSDIYSLGIVFYEMLLGEVPFDGKDSISIGIKHVKEPVPVLPSRLAALQPLMDRLLAKTANGRYSRGRELITDVDKLRLGALRNQKRDGSGQVRAVAADRAVHHAPERTAAAKKSLDDTIPPQSHSRRPWFSILLVTAALGGLGYYAWSSGALTPLWQQITEDPRLAKGSETLSKLLGKRDDSAATALPQAPVTGVTPADETTATEEAASRLAGAMLGSAINSQFYPARIPGDGIAAQAAATLSDIDPGSLPTLVDNETRIINEMLSEAETMLAAGQLVSPPGDNALERYQGVLTLDETNVEALAGRHVIALHYISLTDQALAAKSLQPAALHLQQARAINPQLAEIAERQAQLDEASQLQQARVAEAQAKAEVEDNRADAMLGRFKLTGLLRSAQYDIAEGRYTSPAGSNALEKYRQVLALSPGNAEARQGLESLSLELESQLDAAIEANDSAREKALIQELKLINHNNPRLQQATETVTDPSTSP